MAHLSPERKATDVIAILTSLVQAVKDEGGCSVWVQKQVLSNSNANDNDEDKNNNDNGTL